MSDIVSYWKNWCLTYGPEDVAAVVVVPIGFEKGSQADLDMREGLYQAAHERPEITEMICSALAVPSNPRLALILLKLAYDLWRVNPRLLQWLLMILYMGATEEVRSILEEEITLYKNGEDAAFRDFLLTNGF